MSKCTIHVAINHRIRSSTSSDGSYTLEPFQEHPIILSLHRFKKVRERKKGEPFVTESENMICDKYIMKLLPNQHFQFKASPSPKANCYVQLYIDPAPCKFWLYESSMYFQLESKPFDRMYLDPGFVYQAEDVNELFKSEYNFAKSGLFFIHIMKPRKLQRYAYEVLFKVDYAWQQAMLASAYNFIQPTKLLLQIEQQYTHGPFIPAYGGVLTCQNYDKWWKRMDEACKAASSVSHEKRIACLSMSVEYFAEFPDMLEYSGSTKNSWRQLEDIVAKSENCQNPNMWIGSPSRKPSRKMNIYIGEMTRKEVLEEDTDVIENVILTLLFRNVTMFGSDGDDSLYTALFFPYLRVVKTISMFTESTGYVWKLSQIQFITCAPVAQGSQLLVIGVVDAFQANLGLVLVVVGIMSGLSFYFVLIVTESINPLKKTKSSSYYLDFVWDFLLVQKKEAMDNVRLIGGAWLLICIVVGSSYICSNINELTAPLRIKRVEKFDELFTNNFSIYSTIASSYHNTRMGAIVQDAGSKNKLNSKIVSVKLAEVFGEIPESVFMKLFIKAHPKLSYENARSTALEIEKNQRKSYMSTQDMASSKDMEYFVNVLAKCDRDAFVDAKDTLDRIELRLKHLLKYQLKSLWQLTVSKDSYGELIENWKFANIPWPATNFLIRAHGLLESGLVPRWKEWIHWVTTLSDKRMTSKQGYSGYRVASINGNILALFFVYLALSSISILLFAREVCISRFIVEIECTINWRH
ncbi:unnamed protein product [Orchesella dallaii]|uniref:Uncharacterized protein n=1 Tax=Orchesella dallaii TaxID=48710 RepID=A0ABP1Q1G7_9HEXA